MHAVEDAKRKSNVHNSSPHLEFVEFGLSVMVKLRTGAKCWHDPQLSTKKRENRLGIWFC